MASTATQKKHTYEDYLKTPDDVRYELIEGELLKTPSPVPRHQRISIKIAFNLEGFVTNNDLGEIFHAPCDVHLDSENVVQPDILFIFVPLLYHNYIIIHLRFLQKSLRNPFKPSLHIVSQFKNHLLCKLRR